MPSGILFDLTRLALDRSDEKYLLLLQVPRDRTGNFVLLLVSVTTLQKKKKEKVKVGRKEWIRGNGGRWNDIIDSAPCQPYIAFPYGSLNSQGIAKKRHWQSRQTWRRGKKKEARTKAVEKGGWPHAQAGMSLSSKRILNGGSAEVTSDILLAVCTEGNDGPARGTSSRRISVNDSR